MKANLILNTLRLFIYKLRSIFLKYAIYLLIISFLDVPTDSLWNITTKTILNSSQLSNVANVHVYLVNMLGNNRAT